MNYVAGAFGTTTSHTAATPQLLSAPGVYLHLRQHGENSVKNQQDDSAQKISSGDRDSLTAWKEIGCNGPTTNNFNYWKQSPGRIRFKIR